MTKAIRGLETYSENPFCHQNPCQVKNDIRCIFLLNSYKKYFIDMLLHIVDIDLILILVKLQLVDSSVSKKDCNG